MEKFGSGINIPDPQHCWVVLDLTNRVVEAWNSILNEIKNSKTEHMFKEAYRTHRVGAAK
jgi:hypothetical protein